MTKVTKLVVGLVGLLFLTGCGFSKIIGCPFLSDQAQVVAIPNLERGPVPLDVRLAIDLKNAVGLQEVTYLIEWGDGEQQVVYLSSFPSKNPYSTVVFHQYRKEGNYEIRIRAKICDRELIGKATIVVESSVKQPTDSDGDGVADQFDHCPFVKGQPPTGCPLPPPPPPQEPTLILNVDIDPPVIQAGNSVLISVRVGGTAKGSITYMVDCAFGLGAEFNIIVTGTDPFIGECPYLEPGTYTIKVRVLREGLKKEVTKLVEVLPPAPPPRLELQGTITPTKGIAPLAVSILVLFLGTAQGSTEIKVDCENDGRWDRKIELGPEVNIWEARDLCRYERGGYYRLTIRAERGGATAFLGGDIEVFESPRLEATLDAFPTSGSPPLEVIVKVTVGGTATGPITYRLDCTSDGTWEKTETTTNSSFTGSCYFIDKGVKIITVEVARGNNIVAAQAQIIVQ